MSSPVPPEPSPLYAAYLRQRAAGSRASVGTPSPLYAAYLASKAKPSEFADVEAGATTTAPQPANAPALAGAMFADADLQEAARGFGQPQGQPGTLDTRAVQGAIRRANVASGVEEPRLSERLVKAAGLDPGTAAAVTGLENAVRGLPSGAVQGILGGTADAVKAGGILLDPFRALGEMAAGQRPSALQASDLLRDQVEAPAVNAIRDVTRPEGTGGMIGEQVGALATQAGAAKALELASALRAVRLAESGVDAATLARMAEAPDVGQALRLDRRATVAGRAAEAAPANAAAGPMDEAAIERAALQGEGRTPASAMRFLADEFGGASIRAATTLAGGASGAATGYATGDDNNRVGRAITFGLAGAIAGSVLGEAAAKAGTFRRTQLAASDPDVAAVLSEGSPRSSARAAVTGLGAKLAAGARSGFQKVLDDVYAARKFGTDVGKTTAVSEEASRAKGWRGFSDALIGVRAGGAPPTTPTLRLAVEAAKGHEADVTALLRAERAIELDDAGKGWYLATDRATTQRVIQKLGAVPEVRQAADQLRAFYDHLLELRWKNGLLSDAEYQAIRAAHQQYVPFVPATEAEALGAGGSRGGRLFNSTKGVRKLTEGAGGYAKVDPFEQAALDAQRTARDVSRQRVMQQVAGIVEQTPEAAAPFIRRLPSEGLQSATRQAEGRTIDAIVNGKRERYEVLDPDLYDALSQVGPTSQSVVTRLFGPVANALRAGVTSIPSFGLANASRDAFFTTQAFPFPVKSALAGSAAGAVTGAATDPEHPLAGAAKGAALGLGAGIMARHAYRIGTGLSEVLGNTTLYQDWLREGGAGFGWFGASRKDAARLVTQLRHGTRVRDLVNPRTWWDAVQYLNEAIEQAPRVAKYRTDLEAGLSPRAAAVGSREVSVDFAKGGSDPLVKAARGTTAFWNANLQGKLKLGSVFRSPKAWAVGLASMTAPSVALWSINKDDPEYWRRPQWERNLFWLVPAGQEADGRTRFAKIPKPFEVGFAFGSIPERLLDFAYQRDPDRTIAAVKDMMGQTASGLAPVPTAVLPVVETQIGKEGYDTFRQRPIVTSDVQNLPAREQYNLDTPGPAIAVSRGIEAVTGGLVSPSPEKVAHVLAGYGGTLGQRAVELGDKAGKQLGLDTRPVSSRVSPSQWARFVTRPNDFGTDDVQAMYRQFDAGQAHYQKMKDLLDEGREGEAQQYLASHLGELQAYYRLKQPVADFRKLSAMRRATEQDRTLAPEARRQRLDAIGQVAAQVAADAFARPADERMAAR